MAKVRIEKSIAGKQETSFNVPLFIFGIAARLLPETALRELALRGFDVREVVAAAANNLPYQTSLFVREHGCCKQIAITLHRA